MIARDGGVKLLGEASCVDQVVRILKQLLSLSERGNTITEQNVDYAISLVYDDRESDLVEIDKDLICHTLQGKPIKPKDTWDRRNTWMRSAKKMITFGLGPAGTGKDVSGNGDGDHCI